MAGDGMSKREIAEGAARSPFDGVPAMSAAVCERSCCVFCVLGGETVRQIEEKTQ